MSPLTVENRLLIKALSSIIHSGSPHTYSLEMDLARLCLYNEFALKFLLLILF